MADSAARTQRAAALEEKRRRLEDLKKRRENRGADTAKVKASASANLDEYIDGLLSQPASGTTVEAKTTNEEQSTAVEQIKEEENDDGKSMQSTKSNVIAEVAPPPPPKFVETFTVSTQTEDFEFPEIEDLEQEEDDDTIGKLQSKTDVNEDKKKEVEKDPRVLSSKEVEKEIAVQPFSSFINNASKKVERMLGTPLLFDLLSDYVGETDNEKRGETKDANADKFLASRQVYECPKWTGGRDVTDIDWSLLHRELILSTYHVPMSAGSSAPLQKGSAAVSALSPRDTLSSSLTPRSGELQSDGLALIWSLAMPTRPEHIFTCGSPVTAGRFHPSETTLVIGGCESGQLVVWDIRAGRLPVQKSALATIAGSTSKGHTHPIGSMEIIEGGVSWHSRFFFQFSLYKEYLTIAIFV
jgi:dynein intermediate chain, cytosolic